MTGNRFEQYVNDTKRQQQIDDMLASVQNEESEQLQAKLREDAHTVYDLNLRRAEQASGDKPEELWGKEAGELCREFIEFAKQASKHSTTMLGDGSDVLFLGAERLLGPDPREEYTGYKISGVFRVKKVPETRTRITGMGWRSSGYVLPAYSYPQQYEGSEVTRKEISEQFGTIPKTDIVLCADGLIRKGPGYVWPIEVTGINGELNTPKFGEWNIHSSNRSIVVGVDGITEQQIRVTEYTHTRSFTEISAVTGLTRALNAHVLNIQSIIDSLHEAT